MSLKPWREVMKPHPDVAKGRYQAAEFAANLAQVHKGKAEPEYGEPVKFYQRTYLTAGMKRLLVTAVNRLTGEGGDPVVQLKTPFGGGKTHTMLALYHLFSGTPVSELRDVGPVLDDAGLTEVPEAKRVVLVGTDLDATKPRVHDELDGAKVHTLWGEIAAQLGGIEGYEMVADGDRTGSPPGSDTLQQLFERFGPCIIFMDELVAYARIFYNTSERLSGGTFDSILTFIHNLNDAIEASGTSMVVASIPESDIEIGGEGGQQALEHIEHTFARLEAQWSPVGKEEGFEIVRRRLFDKLESEADRDEVCEAFYQIYRDNEDDFPPECKEKPYLEKLKRTYPIHPEVFDRLYDDWSTLERFQKTRGVLRFLAEVIHELWKEDDKNALILPGTLPFDDADVANELLSYLDDPWRTVLDTDIDGEGSAATSVDNHWTRIGQYNGGRKCSRTIFMGSAPSVKEQRQRGIERNRIFLGCIQPGEQVGVYRDGLNRLLDKCTYLYPGDNRFWFDTRPSLRKTVEDRASQLDIHDVLNELTGRLTKAAKTKGDFAGVHVCPSTSAEIPDDDEVRLVLLAPEHVHRDGGDEPAREAATEFLANRGSQPRMYRNMLVFLAPDKTAMDNCLKEVRRYLAWQSVKKDAKLLNLDAHQSDQVENEIERSDETIGLRINEAYCWVLAPNQSSGTGDVEWNSLRVSGGQEHFIQRTSKKLGHDDLLLTEWSPALLKMEIDKWELWGENDHISTEKLWEYLCTYVYLHRLRDVDVLIQAIREGIESTDFFGYAAAVGEDGTYQGLKFGESGTVHIDSSSVLVKPEIAAQQLQEAAEAAGESPPSPGEKAAGTGGQVTLERGASEAGQESGAEAAGALPKRFWGHTDLDDPAEAAMRLSQIVDGIVDVLRRKDGTEVKISVDIQAENEDGFDEKVQHDVEENLRTTKVEGGFEKG